MSTERAVDPATSPPADGGGAGRVFALARLGLAVLVLLAVSIALAKNWSAVARHLADVSGPAWAFAIAVSLASPILTVLGWRALLADLGSPLHLAPASGVFLVGQLGKYLPGSVWSVVAQTEMAARLGVPRRRTGIVGLVTMALALLTGAAVGLPAIPLLLRRGGGDSVWFVAVAAALLVLAFWPPLLNRMIDSAKAMPVRFGLTEGAMASSCAESPSNTRLVAGPCSPPHYGPPSPGCVPERSRWPSPGNSLSREPRDGNCSSSASAGFVLPPPWAWQASCSRPASGCERVSCCSCSSRSCRRRQQQPWSS